MEVAQIARSIAVTLNATEPQLMKLKKDEINLDIVEFAGLAHDLGHPPFGHQGEEILDKILLEHGGYEGNAQTLRILTQLEKKGFEAPDFNTSNVFKGLNLTARTLAAILKYDAQIPAIRPKTGKSHPLKAYYNFDNKVVEWIKEKTVGKNFSGKFKTVECRIMDVADDIAYSTYDLEDGLKAGFYTLSDVIWPTKATLEKISQELHGKVGDPDVKKVKEVLQDLFKPFITSPIINDIYSKVTQAIANGQGTLTEKLLGHVSNLSTDLHTEMVRKYSFDGFARSYLTSSLVDMFMNGVRFSYNSRYPSQSDVYLHPDTLLKVEVLKKFTFISQVDSTKLKVSEVRGQEIVNSIFDYINTSSGKLLPDDFRSVYYNVAGNETDEKRVICDFIAGMTDRYAIEFYGRLKSENPETIFKPI
jgi:dGTPase